MHQLKASDFDVQHEGAGKSDIVIINTCGFIENAKQESIDTILQFAEEIIKLTGTQQKIVFEPLPKDDPTQRQPDITKAREILGWEPKVSRAEGWKITYDAFRALPEEVLYKQEHRDFKAFVK